jgi:hypothetical protein
MDGDNSGMRQPSRGPGFDYKALAIFLFRMGFKT